MNDLEKLNSLVDSHKETLKDLGTLQEKNSTRLTEIKKELNKSRFKLPFKANRITKSLLQEELKEREKNIDKIEAYLTPRANIEEYSTLSEVSLEYNEDNLRELEGYGEFKEEYKKYLLAKQNDDLNNSPINQEVIENFYKDLNLNEKIGVRIMASQELVKDYNNKLNEYYDINQNFPDYLNESDKELEQNFRTTYNDLFEYQEDLAEKHFELVTLESNSINIDFEEKLHQHDYQNGGMSEHDLNKNIEETEIYSDQKEQEVNNIQSQLIKTLSNEPNEIKAINEKIEVPQINKEVDLTTDKVPKSTHNELLELKETYREYINLVKQEKTDSSDEIIIQRLSLENSYNLKKNEMIEEKGIPGETFKKMEKNINQKVNGKDIQKEEQLTL